MFSHRSGKEKTGQTAPISQWCSRELIRANFTGRWRMRFISKFAAATIPPARGNESIGSNKGSAFRRRWPDESAVDPRVFSARGRKGAPDHEALRAAGNPLPLFVPALEGFRSRDLRFHVWIA